MKYYIGHATTQFEGMEWGQKFVVKARNEQSAYRKAEREDWTHGDGIEQLEDIIIYEITQAHYEVLKEYHLVVPLDPGIRVEREED